MPSLTTKWSFSFFNTGFSWSPPAHKIYALNPDGTLKWTYATGSDVKSSPAIADDGTIYIGSLDHKLYALRPNGTLKWSYTTGGLIYSSPAIGTDEIIYIGSHDHKLYAINSEGTKKWSYDIGRPIYSSPAISEQGTIYVGAYTGELYAIGNQPPSANFTYSPTSPTTEDTIQFTDQSSDADGSIQSWSWNFGDGSTSSKQNPTHSYADADTYTVTLTVTDDDGATDNYSDTVNVSSVPNESPSASFTYSPSSPSVDNTVQFDASGSYDNDGSIQSYSWNFGDGSTATGQTANHVFESSGVFTVTLTVTDDDGATGSSQKNITVKASETEKISTTIQIPPSALARRRKSLYLSSPFSSTRITGDCPIRPSLGV